MKKIFAFVVLMMVAMASSFAEPVLKSFNDNTFVIYDVDCGPEANDSFEVVEGFVDFPNLLGLKVFKNFDAMKEACDECDTVDVYAASVVKKYNCWAAVQKDAILVVCSYIFIPCKNGEIVLVAYRGTLDKMINE